MMVVNLFKTENSFRERHAVVEAPQRTASPNGSAAGETGIDLHTRCAAMRRATRTMLKLAGEAAIDLWSGYSDSVHLSEFDIAYSEQLEALDSLRQADCQADLRFLTHKAELAFVAFAEAVRREVVDSAEPAMSEADFRAALGRVKDCAIAASESIGAIQRAAVPR